MERLDEEETVYGSGAFMFGSPFFRVRRRRKCKYQRRDGTGGSLRV